MFNIEKFKEELSKYGLTLETYDKIITDIDSKIDGENGKKSSGREHGGT